MRESLPIHDAVMGQMVRGRGFSDQLPIRGLGHYRLTRGGVLIAEADFHNAVTNVAKNDLLNVYFDASTHSTTWGIGLIDNGTFSTTSAADTAASHSGWNEYTNYTITGGSSLLRGSWSQGSPVGQQITNSSPVAFTFTTSPGALWGIMVIADTTKSGTSGILWSTAPFNAVLNVLVGDLLNVTYTIQL